MWEILYKPTPSHPKTGSICFWPMAAQEETCTCIKFLIVRCNRSLDTMQVHVASYNAQEKKSGIS